ncbi:DUF3987 domain-containing protein [Rugamonas apoptosis]|uniref:DUF3987 domain-containing protein n=1 Tax=Rugamonas apoptosis TaxID=2758570 RepID=A0A7W2F6C6_9BURK|nr:DUF3987 domain-containing protein [Rugamonas apoptosis]MBA5685926.1 DUF3987 domain-containing protein [Rugamonas apoptosis]
MDLQNNTAVAEQDSAHQPVLKKKPTFKELATKIKEERARRAKFLAEYEKKRAQEDDATTDGEDEFDTDEVAPAASPSAGQKMPPPPPANTTVTDEQEELPPTPSNAGRIVVKQKPPYPVHAFGVFLEGLIMLIASAIQVAPELVGSVMLGMLSALAQPLINVSVKASGKGMPVSLNLFIIAASGERKSSTLQAVAKPMYLAISRAIDQRRQMIIQDITVDGMVVGLIERCVAQYLLVMEGATLLSGHAMKQENLGRFLGIVSSLYSNEAISRTRVDQHCTGEDRRLSATIFTQPIVAMEFLSSEMVMQQGLGNRFLYSQPQSLVGSRQFNDIDLDSDPLYLDYCEKIGALANLPWTINEHTQGVEPQTMRLSSEAKQVWAIYYNKQELAAGPGGEMATHAGYVTRFAEQVLRTSAVLEFVENPHAVTISADTMARAIELGDYYLGSAMEAFTAAPANKTELDARTLLEWMKNKTVELNMYAIPARMMYQDGPRCARPSTRTNELLSVLLARGEVSKDARPVQYKGKRSNDNYTVTGMGNEPE